jgi:hypothetical protein
MACVRHNRRFQIILPFVITQFLFLLALFNHVLTGVRMVKTICSSRLSNNPQGAQKMG